LKIWPELSENFILQILSHLKKKMNLTAHILLWSMFILNLN